MSKGSDINVGSIEEDIKNLEKYIELVIDKNYCECNELNVICYGKYADGSKNVASSIKNILKDYARQKQINEEHQKINGELREQVRMLEEDIKEIKESIEEAYRCYEYDLDYSPFSKGIAEMIENILAEREQDKKRIQELEEEVLDERERAMHYEEDYQKAKDEQKIIMANSIPNQVVIDAINKHKFAYEELSKMYNNTHYEDDEIRARDFYVIVTEDRIVQVLTKLLGGEK